MAMAGQGDEGAEDDAALLRAYAAGDAAAFERLYRRHELPAWRYLMRTLGNRAIADELMQEVWFSVAREAPRWRPEAKFRTWLYTLAHNRMVDHLRARRSTESLDGHDPPDESPQPPELLQRRQRAEALLAAVDRLPLEQREAFLLQAEAGLALEEIAAATGTGFETVKSRLRYARAHLRDWLEEHA